MQSASHSADIPAVRTRRTLRVIARFLVVLVVGNSIALAAAPIDKAAKFKEKVAARGLGNGVTVKEVNGTLVSGVVTAIHDDTFEVAPKGAMQPVVIPYAQVASLHGTGMSTGAKIGIGVAIGVVSIFVAAAIALRNVY